MASTGDASRLERSIRLLWGVMTVAALIALLSLAINVFLVLRLWMVREQAVSVLDSASHSLDNLAWQGLSFDFPISQTVNFEGDVPFNQDLVVPFKGEFPINTTVSIPLNLGLLGTQTINVPVKTQVPVNVMVPIHIEQAVHIKAQIPVQMSVPVHLDPNEPPLKDWLTQVRGWVRAIRNNF